MVAEAVTSLLVDRLKRARSARGWTAQQLADACAAAGAGSPTRGTLAKIESGARKTVSAEEIAVLAHVLGTTPTALLATEKWPFTVAVSTLHLVVVVEPDAIESGQFHVTSWRQEEADVWPPPRGESRLMPVEHLERHVAELASAAEAAWVEHTGPLNLEFVLPHELMDLPVHGWHQDFGVDGGRPLALDYAISVRSLERMRMPGWHRRWRIRWDSMIADPSPDRVYYAHPEDFGVPGRFEAALSDDRWTAVVLPGLAAPPLRDELPPALRSGLPIVLWHPRGSEAPVRERIRALAVEQSLVDLPLRIRSLRRDLQDDAVFADIARNLRLLWDDPRRLVFFGRAGEASPHAVMR